MSTISLRNMATKSILDRIQHGDISPDEIITESQICDTLNISRTPVREALIELVANGVLERIPRKGYRICDIDQKQKINAYVILGVLDALAAKLSINNITDQDIRRMNETIDLIDIAIKYENYSSYCELQEKFHRIYIDRCDNPQLEKMLEEIKASVSRYTYFSENSEKLFTLCRAMNEEHREIVKFFERRDASGLEDYLINTHWITKHFDAI
ncbi:GntR family transcriptional regulator [Sinanaerobacter chloroacetimidivorans]|jgi:DNA-binding GntR family transcriptional regulator|uniref:GntR family transcriptional regulator n=1 Tax=Sinanaerobacter chloroacetimidivorans TaxID=2818044 RepID=A0A8J7W4E1_9FIRM|nr:GntR family transcriptional regulator [Sinanaerobacter chloroacetimidivorans]MBR0599143.1 GntR family transcriptional regulator [Sinanaerobacter chloroacetimidivorans]